MNWHLEFWLLLTRTSKEIINLNIIFLQKRDAFWRLVLHYIIIHKISF